MIQFLGVTKRYRPEGTGVITALDNVSFEINEGEFVFIVGHSGSGKTTILRQIIREELPTSGKIYFKDTDITRLRRNGIYKLRREIGTIFQDYKLIEDKNAYENISFAMEAAGMTSKEVKETVPYVLDIVNLSDRAKAFPEELSGGEKQRVAIARAIVNNPKVLIADEPTGNLDPDSAWDVVQVLDKINKWGTTVIMSTHGTEIVNSLQKRVLKMEKGKLVRDDKKGGYSEVDEFALKVLGEDGTEDVEKKENSNKKKSERKEKEEKEQKVKKENNSGKDSKNTDKTDKTGKKDSKKQVEKETPKVSKKEEKELDELIHKADVSGLGVLELNKDLEKKLQKEGFDDVEDILSAGIGEVNKHLNQKQIRQLAKAIKKFVTTE